MCMCKHISSLYDQNPAIVTGVSHVEERYSHISPLLAFLQLKIYAKFMTLLCTVPSQAMILDYQMPSLWKYILVLPRLVSFFFFYLRWIINPSFSLRINRRWIDGGQVFAPQIFLACQLCGQNCLTCSATHFYLMDAWQYGIEAFCPQIVRLFYAEKCEHNVVMSFAHQL